MTPDAIKTFRTQDLLAYTYLTLKGVTLLAVEQNSTGSTYVFAPEAENIIQEFFSRGGPAVEFTAKAE